MFLPQGCEPVCIYGPIASVKHDTECTSHPRSSSPLPSRALSGEPRGGVFRRDSLIGRREEDITSEDLFEFCPPPALSKQVQIHDKGAASSEESRAAAGSSESTGHPDHAGIACPVAMRESDHQPVAARKGGKQQLGEFYFNLGRSMVLDSIG